MRACWFLFSPAPCCGEQLSQDQARLFWLSSISLELMAGGDPQSYNISWGEPSITWGFPCFSGPPNAVLLRLYCWQCICLSFRLKTHSSTCSPSQSLISWFSVARWNRRASCLIKTWEHFPELLGRCRDAVWRYTVYFLIKSVMSEVQGRTRAIAYFILDYT